MRPGLPAIDSGAGLDGREITPALIAELRAAVGDEHVVTHEHQLRTYESDGLLQYAVTPGAVVLPGSTEDVQAVVRACHRAGVPWVARGAGSGLSGGATPVPDGILISLSRMRKILEVDLANQRVVVEPGRDQHRRVAGRRPRPLLPARPVVADRLHDRRQRRRELGRRALLQVRVHDQLRDRPRAGAAGRRAGAARRQGARLPGPDLLGAFVGSEGTLGIATKIWLRIVPKPEAVRTLVAFFGCPIQAGEVVSEIVAAGIVPGAIEMMDNLSIRAAEGYTNAGYPTDAGAGARGRAGRLGGRVRDALRGGRRDLRARRGRLDPRRRGRGRARADLARPQGGVRRDGPHRARTTTSRTA